MNGGWGDFGAWDDCPVSCGGAEHSRYRVCDSPAPAHGGDDCTVDGSTDTETEKCNENPCPSKLRKFKCFYDECMSLIYFYIVLCLTVNGGWGDFGAWDDCPVSCGGAEHSRYRACDNPAPEHGGDDCTLDGSTDTETEKCNENPCPSKFTS